MGNPRAPFNIRFTMNRYLASVLMLLLFVVAATSASDFDNNDMVVPESDDVLVDAQEDHELKKVAETATNAARNLAKGLKGLTTKTPGATRNAVDNAAHASHEVAQAAIAADKGN